MAAIFAQCPTCGNPTVGDNICRCPRCGKICCVNCTQETGTSFGICPHCGFDKIGLSCKIGEIGRF